MKLYDIVVIGGGPAGMMAAIRAGQLGKNVILIERNDSMGKKIMLTGSGRCNITNTASINDFIQKFGKHGKFLKSVFYTFSHESLMDFFKLKGLEFKVEEKGRVFPASNTSESIIKVLKEYLSENNVKIMFNSHLLDIKKENDIFQLILENDKINTKKVILATGGASYKSTGSTGDGFHIARKLGHTIEPLRPGLVPLKVNEDWIKDLQGISLEKVHLTFKYGKKKRTSDSGNLIFTHFGISGPLVLDLSSEIIKIIDKEGSIGIFIDLKSEMNPQKLEESLIKEFEIRRKTEIKNLMKLFLPNRMIPIFMDILRINPQKKVNQITKGERKSIVNLLKAFPLTITGSLPLENAMITCGGISKKEIDPRTMESKIMKGLYFAGEIIDLCASSGGYNLQEAFSTGYLAGESAASVYN